MEEAAKETVIVVHGTFAAPKLGASQWYQPTDGMPATQGFIAQLNRALEKRGLSGWCWAHCSHSNQGFHWSGDNNWVARTQAAAELGNMCSTSGRRVGVVTLSHTAMAEMSCLKPCRKSRLRSLLMRPSAR